MPASCPKPSDRSKDIFNSLPVARPGLPFIAVGLALSVLFWCLRLEIPAAAFSALTLFVIWFFRDPDRTAPSEACGLSPADGKVIILDPEASCPATGNKALKVSIFMDLFSVHVNRSPLSGTLESQTYHPGTMINASFDKASEQNERNVLYIKGEDGKSFAMVQVAGLVARRIVSWVKDGDALERGQRFGMIRFGSRLDLYLPPDAVPLVSLGQKVKAGLSPVWKLPENEQKND